METEFDSILLKKLPEYIQKSKTKRNVRAVVERQNKHKFRQIK